MNKTRIFRVPKRLLNTASALVAVSMTHIRYKAGDLFGWVMGWFSLLPVFIGFGGFTTLVLFRRELQTVFFALGLLLCETSNQIMKNLVREPRPTTCGSLEACESFGWPSGHSQFMLFFAVYLTFLCTFKFTFAAEYVKQLTIALAWALAPLVMYSRVYLGYHSVKQVFAGAALGIVLGSLWYRCVDRYFTPKFQQFEKSKLCQFFRIKDNSHIPDVLGFEYKVSQKVRTNGTLYQRLAIHRLFKLACQGPANYGESTRYHLDDQRASESRTVKHNHFMSQRSATFLDRMYNAIATGAKTLKHLNGH